MREWAPIVVDVEASPLGQGDLLHRLDRGEVHAVRVRRAFPAARIAEVAAALEAGSFAIAKEIDTPEGDPVRLFGIPLQWATADLARYHQAGARFREACAGLWGGFDYESRIRELIGTFAADRPVELMRGPRGEAYGAATIRRIAPGGSIPPHLEQHQLGFPGCASLQSEVGGSVMSFFTLLSPAEGGGRLRLHAMTGDDFERAPRAAAGQRELQEELDRYPRGEVELERGDTLFFNGGRFFHEVTPVGGTHSRWTIGGFFALRRGGERVLYWA